MGEKLLLFCGLLANWALIVVPIKISVPQYGIMDGSTTLGCFFDLGLEKLFVLKWYKDGHEFFRYSPHSPQPILTFPANGVMVEIPQSTMNQIVLRNISLQTSGSFKCEITEGSTFRTLSQTSDLIVVAPPRGLPQIDCHPQTVQPGDTLKCNCTSYASKPAASLMFYLNDGKANFGDMIEYYPVLEPSSGLETAILGLEFSVEAFHIKNGALRIKCTATIGNSYFLANVSLSEAVNAQPSSPGHNLLLSGSSSRGNGTPGLLTLFFTFLFTQHFHSPFTRPLLLPLLH